MSSSLSKHNRREIEINQQTLKNSGAKRNFNNNNSRNYTKKKKFPQVGQAFVMGHVGSETKLYCLTEQQHLDARLPLFNTKYIESKFNKTIISQNSLVNLYLAWS